MKAEKGTKRKTQQTERRKGEEKLTKGKRGERK